VHRVFLCQTSVTFHPRSRGEQARVRGARAFFIKLAGLDMHPLERWTALASSRTRRASASATSPVLHRGLSEHIHITTTGSSRLKERMADDSSIRVWLLRKFRPRRSSPRDDCLSPDTLAGRAR